MSKSTEVHGADTKSKIVACVRNNEGISRHKIAELTGLSNATVIRVVESLIRNDDILEEKGCKSMPRGRPRKLLYFKGHNIYIIGIDLGTTYIRGIIEYSPAFDWRNINLMQLRGEYY